MQIYNDNTFSISHIPCFHFLQKNTRKFLSFPTYLLSPERIEVIHHSRLAKVMKAPHSICSITQIFYRREIAEYT